MAGLQQISLSARNLRLSHPFDNYQPLELPNARDLRRNSRLWFKILVLIYDLQSCSYNESSGARLVSALRNYTQPPCISLPYFTAEEVLIINSFKVDGHILSDHAYSAGMEEVLNVTGTFEYAVKGFIMRMFQKKRLEGEFVMCAFSDLATLYCALLGVRWSDIGDVKFLARVEQAKFTT